MRDPPIVVVPAAELAPRPDEKAIIGFLQAEARRGISLFEKERLPLNALQRGLVETLMEKRDMRGVHFPFHILEVVATSDALVDIPVAAGDQGPLKLR